MDITEVLLTLAQAAMVIAGFGGVVISFQNRARQWSEWNRIEFRSILDISGLVIFFAMLPVILPALLDLELSWRIAIVSFAIAHAAIIVHYRMSVSADSIPPVFSRVHVIAGLIIVAKLLAGIFGSLGLVQIFYSFGLFWLICIGGWLFYLLALGPAPDEEP